GPPLAPTRGGGGLGGPLQPRIRQRLGRGPAEAGGILESEWDQTSATGRWTKLGRGLVRNAPFCGQT
ncbi:hypothetical protein, partial [Limosilactobacillus fermentum]|uniref:hypothetical protein n=1 Tax=Limosilactobacillus fermentum TaxID=1613 RepID=UPI001CD871FB